MKEKSIEVSDSQIQKPLVEESNKKERPHKVWRRKYIHEVNKDNDIKFSAPFSYRHLRIFGWIFLAVAQVGTLLTFGQLIYKNDALYGNWPGILSFFSVLMSPLFLIAAFSVVLNAKNGYKRLITLYSGVSVLMFLAFLLVYEYYIVGTYSIAVGWDQANIVISALFGLAMPNGFLAFNIFIDLTLCTLVTFFINYRPKKYFQGKKIYIFRLFALFPILYESASILIKVLTTSGIIFLHPLVFPLLTTKPPVAFLIFVVMALFVKNRERFYIKKGKTHEDYVEFLDTNVNSFHFSLFLVGTIVVAAIIDLLIFIVLFLNVLFTKIPIDTISTVESELFGSTVLQTLVEVSSWGIGKTVLMVLIIPILLLFDYKKSYKNPMMDTIIPIAGIAVIALIYIEGGYEVIKQYLVNLIKMSEESSKEPAEKVLEAAKNFKNLILKK